MATYPTPLAAAWQDWRRAAEDATRRGRADLVAALQPPTHAPRALVDERTHRLTASLHCRFGPTSAAPRLDPRTV